MRVSKFGHSCLLIEKGEARILIDPGEWSTLPKPLKVDAILVTHEHPDHISIPSLKTLLADNPDVHVYTNVSVGKLLEKESIPYVVLGGGESTIIREVTIEGVGEEHACIHDSIPLIKNTGYRIAKRFFYPGDALTSFPEGVEVLALPVSAPWMRLSEAIAYAAKIKPKVCFPVHDAMLRPDRVGSTRKVSKTVLEPLGIEFRDMVEGAVEEF